MAGAGDSVTLHLADGGTIDADVLIAADGIRSAFRGTFGPAPLVPSGRVAWRALVPAENAPTFAREKRSNLWLGPDAHLVHYPLRGGSVVNIVAVTTERGPANMSDDLWTRDGDPKILMERFADWHRDAKGLLQAATDWRVWPLLARAMPKTFAKGRIALVGDAAHSMMPFLAQGAAQAIEDAAALGDAFAADASPHVAFAHYSAQRYMRVKKIVEASSRQARIYHFDGVAAVGRDTAMRLLGPSGMRAGVDWIYRG